MLTSIRIQNFRSIRDASVKLGQVNLFIGPNNSGKSNFLKGIDLAASLLANTNKDGRAGRNNLPKELQETPYGSPATMVFTIDAISEDAEAHVTTTASLTDDILQLKTSIKPFVFQNSLFSDNDSEKEIQQLPYDLRSHLRNTIIYNTNPERLRGSVKLKNINNLSSDGTDLVLFLFSLSQNNRLLFKKIEADLKNCIQDLVSVSTPPDPEEPGKLKLKFFDQNDVGYWAEEVSEGVIYLLALLCIVHQPNPPKLLLLEEPEKGIHPRRIKEVIDFIFELARLRNIQIILTSHSPYVVDHFADIPECISVFDRENGETVIHNAADLIEKTNKEYAAQGLPPTKYKDSLGEYWVSGFLGGVPL